MADTYVVSNPCIIVELTPEGILRIVSRPNDPAVAGLLLTYLNYKLPEAMFSPAKNTGKILPFHGPLPPLPKQ